MAGIGIGWLAATSGIGNSPPETARSDSPCPSARPRPSASSGEARNARLRALADDPIRLETESASLPAKELQALIDLLAARAGVEGLPGEERERIKRMVKHRYVESPEDFLSWILATVNPGNRRFYFEAVFESAAGKDPQQALEMAEQFRRDTGDSVSLPPDFINRVARFGADSLVRAMALTLGKVDSMSGWAVEFPADFDFEKAANGIAGLYSRKNVGENFRTYPCNLVAEWVRRDANAAYAWAVANDAQGRMFSSGLSDFFTGYAKVVEPADYGRFAAQATLEGEPTEKSWGNALSALIQNPDSTVVEAFLSEASTHRDSGEILTKLLDASVDYYSCDMLRRHLFIRLSEEQRAKYLLTAPENVRRKLVAEPAP